MAEPFIAEIRLLPFDFAPVNWAFCNGQTIPIAQNTALFSLLGTVYGGNGTTTFGLPDIRGRIPMQADPYPGITPPPPGAKNPATGLSYHDLGEIGGETAVTLNSNHMPLHQHPIGTAAEDPAETNDPAGNVLARSNVFAYSNDLSTLTSMGTALQPAGGGGSHNNLMPYLTLNFCIALHGIVPPRG
jgi:microcystin-dependent protein